MNNLWGRLKNARQVWRGLVRRIGNFQARVLLTVLYVIVVMPIGTIVRLFADPLRLKRRPQEWLPHPDETYDQEWARKQ